MFGVSNVMSSAPSCMVSEGKRSFHCRRKFLTAHISGWRTVALALNKHSVNVIFVLGININIFMLTGFRLLHWSIGFL